MATITIFVEVGGVLFTRDEALAIADCLVDRAGLRNTPDLGHEHGNTTGVRMPLIGVSRWVHGEFKDGRVPDPMR
jgi:hypothetical protein